MQQFVDEIFNSGLEEEAVIKTTNKKIFVVFSNEAEIAQMQYFETESEKPIILCKTLDASGIKNEETIIIRAKEYKVKSKKPDGTGLTYLALAIY